jgi:hypothetical protein
MVLGAAAAFARMPERFSQYSAHRAVNVSFAAARTLCFELHASFEQAMARIGAGHIRVYSSRIDDEMMGRRRQTPCSLSWLMALTS